MKKGVPMNLFALPPLPLPDELVTVLAENKQIRIERIVSTGQTSPWYDQEQSEFVALLQGRAELLFDSGKTIALTAGDTLVIPPHQRHRVSYTSTEPPCVWLCAFFGAAEDSPAPPQHNDPVAQHTREELEQAQRAIESTIRKCEKVQPKLQQGTSQHTLLVRRIKAFHIASNLLTKELDSL